MRKLIVEVAADITQYIRGFTQAADVTSILDKQVKELDVNTTQLAKAQVSASVKATQRLRSQAAAYRELAASAEKGSQEQIAATKLAADAEKRLAVATGEAAAATTKQAGSARVMERDMGKATRGFISGSGAMAGFGKSLAFASGGFLAFEGISEFLKGSIGAAREAGVAQRQLSAQMRASGESFSANREEIEKTVNSYEKFGFKNTEVEQGLTVLTRGTGKVSQSLKLLQLTADIARAKNLDFGKAAVFVAKVFGGQESALRRAVPGLAKNAHGWDLIRLAQHKMAGQAAAATTTSERFAATLHNTEEIVGTALLPVLNKFLTTLGNWLQKQNETGNLQRNVNKAMKLFNDALAVAKALLGPVVSLFKALASAVGGTANAMKVLLGVWLAWKAAATGAEMVAAVKGITAVGTEATATTARLGALRGGLLGLLGVSGIVGTGLIAGAGAALLVMQQRAQDAAEAAQKAEAAPLIKGSGLETTLVPRLAKQIAQMKAAGQTSKTILATLRQQLGGSLKADDLIAEAFAFKSGADPKLQQRIRKQVREKAESVVKTASDEVTKATKDAAARTPAQRNQWFDALISRSLGRVSGLPLQQQLTKLSGISKLLTDRIAKTKDITRKLNLEDQLYSVQQQRKGVREQLAQQFQDGLQLKIDTDAASGNLNAQLADLQSLGAYLDRRIAVETDIGKKQELENQKLQNIGNQKAVKEQMFQNFMDALDLGVQRAQLTKGVNDDIAALKKELRAIEAREKLVGRTVALEQQRIQKEGELAQLEQQGAQDRADARKAAQYKLLGLGPTGEALIPSARSLRRQLARVANAFDAAGLLTPKIAKTMAAIRKVLAQSAKGISSDVRSTIAQMISDLLQQLTDAKAKAKEKAQESSRTEGTGGSGGFGIGGGSATGISAFMPTQHGLVPISGKPVGGVPSTPYVPPPHTGAPSGGFQPTSYTINGGVNLYGVQNVNELETQLEKRAQARPQTRRGPV